MRDPIIEKLSRFSADGSGLDRDALLFAAGRASARPNRGWILATGSLVVCQLLTVTLLWPNPATTPLSPSVEPIATAPLPISFGPAPSDAAEPGLLTRQLLQSGAEDLPSPVVASPMVPNDPPLHAFVGSIPVGLE